MLPDYFAQKSPRQKGEQADYNFGKKDHAKAVNVHMEEGSGYSRKENKTFLANVAIGFSYVD